MKHFVFLIIFLCFATTHSLFAQSKSIQGASVIGIGKIVKNTKAVKDTKEFVKLSTSTKSNEIDNKTNPNNNNNRNNENQDFVTSMFNNAETGLYKENKKTIDSLEKSAKGFKDFGNNVTGLFNSNFATSSADPNNDDDNNFTKVSGEKVSSKATDKSIVYEKSQLQHAYRHAEQFGVKGNANSKTLAEFEKALQKHVASTDTKIIEGTYRGQKVTHFYNDNTKLNIIRKDGKFVSGWKLGKDQIKNITTRGSL